MELACRVAPGLRRVTLVLHQSAGAKSPAIVRDLDLGVGEWPSRVGVDDRAVQPLAASARAQGESEQDWCEARSRSAELVQKLTPPVRAFRGGPRRRARPGSLTV